MEPIFEAKKLELHYNNVGDEKPRQQTLNNMKKDSKNEEIVQFGQLMGQLAPQDEAINAVMVIEKSRFDIK
ncbi:MULTISPECIES: hypothetical protein [Vagococcus]|uniref:DUF1659 domain-containing protein n=1 Tax=Vagococcus fluvialis bH819 TaxID=1255619 RepID=A0A1X6WKP3_9ENTE|nr:MULTISPECIES: hypothetical protein [Vagococcus]SLM84894.1 hypothetical protein FM121_02285 [Vagococcus fluvialis bH819]HCM90434.1 hypothetical protein [Vagococcus sp.]